MKTKTRINLEELKKEEMQEIFSEYIDFSKGGHLKEIDPEIEKKSGRLSMKEEYIKALEELKNYSGLEEPEAIISFFNEQDKLSVTHRLYLRTLEKFH